MAPAAASTIESHFTDYGSQPEEYDKIITGDLGSVGQRVLLDLLRDKGIDIADRHMDCGMEIYDAGDRVLLKVLRYMTRCCLSMLCMEGMGRPLYRNSQS